MTRSPRPLLCAIVGDHATGKRRLANTLADLIGADTCALLALDDYIAPAIAESAEPSPQPGDADLALMAQHLRLLRQGETVFKPVRERRTGELARPEFVHPAPIIFAHGRFGLASPELRALWDASIFVERETATTDDATPIRVQRPRADVSIQPRPATDAHGARVDLRIATPTPLPALEALRAEPLAGAFHVSHASGGVDFIAIDGSRGVEEPVVAAVLVQYLAQRGVGRSRVSPAEARSAQPAPGA